MITVHLDISVFDTGKGPHLDAYSMTVKIYYTMSIASFHFFVLCTWSLHVIDMTQAPG